MCRRLAYILVLWLFAFVAKAQLNTDQLMLVGRNALYFEDYVLSIQYFNKVISAKPYLHEPYFFRALAKFNLDDFSGAERDLTISIEQNPYIPRNYQLRGLCRANLEMYSEAESDFRNAIKYDPYNPDIWHNLTVTNIRSEKWEAAAAAADSMCVVAPRNITGYLLRAQVALEQKDTLTAYKKVDEALLRDKYSPNVYSMRAMLYAGAERYAEAEADLDYAIELFPARSSNYINRALVRFYRNNLSGAMKDYDIALDIDPQSFVGRYNRALLRMQVGDDNRAIDDFDKILDIDPDNTMARFNRGLLRENTGDIQGAISDYTHVLNDYPNFEYGYSCRSEARRKIGDIMGAEEDELWLLKRNLALQSGVADTISADNFDDKVRKRSDKNVRNYNKMIVDDSMNEKLYANVYRGKVQNRNVYIEPEPMFVLTYYREEREMGTPIHYYNNLDELNRMGVLPFTLLLTNDERALSEAEVKRHFDNIDVQSKNISMDEENIYHRIARAIDHCLVQDFDAALNDLNIALTLDGEAWLIYFLRATVRYKQIEVQRMNNEPATDQLPVYGDKTLSNVDYRLVKSDLDKVVDVVHDFPYSYFNRGNIYIKLNDFKSAVVDYDKAIELNDKFAEAYYNRGLAKIYLGKVSDGIEDLSKAGELGMYTAYSVIKRMKSKEE